MGLLDRFRRPDRSRQAKVNAVWSVDADIRAETQGWYWMAHPMVRDRINTLISGEPGCDAYGRLARLFSERGWRFPIDQAISLGCGFGALERDLAARGMVHEMDAYDLAQGAITEARRLAAAANYTSIRYHVADLETSRFPRHGADVVFAHQSVHHVEALDQLFEKVRGALKPGGVFHLHEFVGPTRFQWTDVQLKYVNNFLDDLPSRLRQLPSGSPKSRLDRPTVEAMIAADPSEAIRSSDILCVLRQHFDVIEERRIGGALLHLALGDIAQNFDPARAEDCAYLERLAAQEDGLMAEGTIASDFVIVTAL